MAPLASQKRPASTLWPAVIVSFVLGIIVASTLAVFAFCGIGLGKSDNDRSLVIDFWHSLFHGLGVGVGVAVGYPFLNWVIGTIDRTKNSLER